MFDPLTIICNVKVAKVYISIKCNFYCLDSHADCKIHFSHILVVQHISKSLMFVYVLYNYYCIIFIMFIFDVVNCDHFKTKTKLYNILYTAR